MGLTLVHQTSLYTLIRQEHEDNGYSIDELCRLARVARSAYYKWLKRKESKNEVENKRIAQLIETIHQKSPDKGYRRIRDDLSHDYNTEINDKRVLRICRLLDIKSTIKYNNHGCTRQAVKPQYIAKNLLNRDFHADKPNEKWLTDVTEFKYYVGIEKHKIYLSAILDLYDRRIVSFIIRDCNDNKLVYDTFNAAVTANPTAQPLFHSDRGFQYTNRIFHGMLVKAGMTQSMSRVGKCIDNGPMEGFWGILKRERYYGKRFIGREALITMIKQYIIYYNTKRVQRNLGVLTPYEKHDMYLAA